LGAGVRSRRLEIGMSQEKLAELIGVTFQQIQKYEKGVNRIAAGRLYAIASALDTPVASFFEGLPVTKGGRASPATGEDALATPEGAELARLFASVRDAKVRRRIVNLVRAMVESEAG
jgi:transcriptional regulator with XRE-family HTH domain